MQQQSHKHLGISKIGIIIIGVVFIFISIGIFVPIRDHRPRNRIKYATMKTQLISIALESYYKDFGKYPLDNNPSTSSAANLWYYLGMRTFKDNHPYGPYLEFDKELLRKNIEYQELISPLGGSYEYKVLTPGKDGKLRFILVDPGPDRQLGGYIDLEKGWIRTGPEADDNLFEGEHP